MWHTLILVAIVYLIAAKYPAPGIAVLSKVGLA